MAKRSRVELFEQIRRARRLEPELSIRQLAGRFGTHRRTVREALRSATPPPRKPVVRPSPVMDPWKVTVDEWLEADRSGRRSSVTPGGGFGSASSTNTKRRWASRRCAATSPRPAGVIRAVLAKVSVPQTHLPGAEAEVDFGQLSFFLAGVPMDGWVFVRACQRRAAGSIASI
jgi:hypothetical protein